MFTINQKAKKSLIALMAVGLIAVFFGFISLTKDAKEEAFRIAKTEVLALTIEDLGDVDDETLKEFQITNRENVESIFHKIEEELHFEFTSSEIDSSFCLNDIIEASSNHINQSFFSRLWPSLLFNNYFFLGIAVFAVFFVALQYVAEAGWSVVLKRVPEAIMGALPVFSLIMLLIIIAAIMHWNHIYHWLHEGIMDPESDDYDKIIAGKEAWLNPAFFIIRTVIYLLVWNYFAKRLRVLSVLEDKQGGTAIHFKGVRASAWFIVFFAVTSAMASWDWIMSIDPHWFSTIFGWYVFAEWGTIGFTAVLLVTLYLKRKGYLQDVNENHIHDLGKWVFAFSLVWTYIWFCQFMLIWYPNIPEEGAYYMARLQDYDNGVANNYKFLFWFSMIINFIPPLILLISRPAKRNNGILIFVSCIILLGHWLNSYLLVTPGALGINGYIGATEIGVGLFFAGVFIYLVLNSLTKQPLETKNHPFLDESKNLHT